ncbi:hypothetical protein NLG97_g504 [Lecanicillium saksenae]|uniref:Uncharacterized protein n=1 Tax=Lecanicillium saksenae TaxID=468837 RepID=A0ACC1R7M7_9HYPO|nr:hypothetical protein NLG97_g504 [Lecanicillium saksenae]
MAIQTWLITGATSGLGYGLVEHVLAQGDQVIASGRNAALKLEKLKCDRLAFLELDITSGWDQVKEKIDKAWGVFGGIDILVNNAGMSAMKSAEEADDAYMQNMFHVNFFGHVHVTKAILPHMRSRGGGCIAFTSSSTVWAMLPFMSHYSASKAALSTYVESLSKEVRPLGIRCVAIECGGFPTQLGQPREPSAEAFGSNGPSIEAYGPLFSSLVGKFMSTPMAHMSGDVAKGAAAIYDIATRQGLAAENPWAVRVALGTDGMGSAKQRCSEQLTLIERWEKLSLSTERADADGTIANRDLFEFTTVLE